MPNEKRNQSKNKGKKKSKNEKNNNIKMTKRSENEKTILEMHKIEGNTQGVKLGQKVKKKEGASCNW